MMIKKTNKKRKNTINAKSKKVKRGHEKKLDKRQ
jgi:hypothetical protein